MSETPDLESLARRYLDLWEAQLSALAGDSALAEQMSRFIAAMGSAGLAAAAAWSATHGDNQPSTAEPGSVAGTPGAAPVHAASGDRDRRLDELARRLAALEERIAALEPATPKRPRGASRKSR
jgi:hypothetical protein